VLALLPATTVGVDDAITVKDESVFEGHHSVPSV
jgi:hypothetical protein